MARFPFSPVVMALLAATNLVTDQCHAVPAWAANLPGEWSPVGRATIHTNADAVVIEDGFVVDGQTWEDADISFRTRAPAGTEQVQLWGGFRYRDRDSRYVFALRGGNNNDIYLARHAPDGGIKFLGFAPLDFQPEPGVWYRLRVVTWGNRFQIYLNDEKLPRLNVADHDASWNKGGVILGGGWLPAEYADLQVKPLAGDTLAAVRAVRDKVWTPAGVDKEAVRQQQRAGYAAAQVKAFSPQRTEISLNGDWLFLPDYQLTAGQMPAASECDDRAWHVMTVPSFWTPGLAWLHGETGFSDLKGAAVTKGVADSLFVRELQRCDSYTYDWRKTKAAWYRQHLDLPDDFQNRRFELAFDAIAKVSEIWVNGLKVGDHTGMFGEVKCDITAALKPGRNVIAVHVVSEADKPQPADSKVEGVAVTVEVTSAMLHSLPHGMLQDNVGGIWQPVKLTVTAPVKVSDVFIEPRLDGAAINLEILNAGKSSAKISVDYSIVAATGGVILYTSKDPQTVELAADESKHLRLITPELSPKLWTPQAPELYNLEVRLKRGDEVVDRSVTRFGFRTFTVVGDKFLMNGQPYWLRGGNPFPNTIRPNDGELAHKFMRLARAGNVRVTRSHIVPFTEIWLDAADQEGMAVSFEGTWPWLMLKGEPPDAGLLKVWKEEFLSLIRKYRNHPSLILWTVNNEMKFSIFDKDNPVLLQAKWTILDDMVKAMRQTDPTRPIVADSGYCRKESSKSYETVVKPNGFDDGDVDDAHRYYGWYNESFFHLYDGQYGKHLGTPGRPLINQEMSTGYPRNDDGHATRFYVFKHYTAQALVGEDAYEQADPAIFLKRQAFMTKELAETIRRSNRDTAAGVLHFSYFTWFKRPWSVSEIEPLPTYYALKTALQPVLVSAELYGRRFYAGRTLRRRVCIVNDAENGAAIPASQLVWEIKDAGTSLAHGRVEVTAVGYYSNLWLEVDFVLPQKLPAPRVEAQLALRLETDGRVLSENSYDVVVATDDWAQGKSVNGDQALLFDPDGRASKILSDIKLAKVDSMNAATNAGLLIIGDSRKISSEPAEIGKLREFIAQGGRVLLLHPGAALEKICPDQIKSFKAKEGEIVTLRIPESPVFSGIAPLDLAWFDRGGRRVPIACTGVYQTDSSREDTTALAWQCDIHGYLDKTTDVTAISGTPLVEIRLGKGRLLASELFLEAGKDDPIARRMLANLISYLR